MPSFTATLQSPWDFRHVPLLSPHWGRAPPFHRTGISNDSPAGIPPLLVDPHGFLRQKGETLLFCLRGEKTLELKGEVTHSRSNRLEVKATAHFLTSRLVQFLLFHSFVRVVEWQQSWVILKSWKIVQKFAFDNILSAKFEGKFQKGNLEFLYSKEGRERQVFKSSSDWLGERLVLLNFSKVVI